MAQLTRFALDAILPLLRPDSYAFPLTGNDLWGIWTPSCWDKDADMKPVLKMGTEREMVRDLEGIGKVEKRKNMYVITNLTEPDYWEHRREDMQRAGFNTW